MNSPATPMLATGVFAAALIAVVSADSGDSPAPSPACPTSTTLRDRPPDDPNASPFGPGPWYINQDKTIWAGTLQEAWISGNKGNKVLWIRPKGTQLQVSGQRLDAEAPPLRARIPCCYPTGFQATKLYFPTTGCWEVRADSGESRLEFVVEIKR